MRRAHRPRAANSTLKMSQLRTPTRVSTDEQAVRLHQIEPALALVDIAPPVDQSARPESMAAPITLAIVVISALVLAVAAALMTAFGA